MPRLAPVYFKPDEDNIKKVCEILNKKNLGNFVFQFVAHQIHHSVTVIFKFENFDQYAIASVVDPDWFPEISRDEFYNIK